MSGRGWGECCIAAACGAVGLSVLGLAGCDGSRPAAAQVAALAAAAQTGPAVGATAISGSEREGHARESWESYATAVGTLRARRSTRVGPQVAGRVQAVEVEVGDRVREGEVVVRLDPTLFEIEVAQSEAAAEAARGALAAAVADLEQKERELRRQADLLARGSGSPKDHDDALAGYAQALGTRAERAGKLAEAEQRVRWAQQRLDETQVRAPYAGAVTARLVDPGEPASAAPVTHLLEIQEVDRLYLEFSLPQELLAEVRAGTALEFQVEGGVAGWRTGHVAVIFPAIDEATRAFRCRAEIDNTDGLLAPGLLARVRVALAEGREPDGRETVAGFSRTDADTLSVATATFSE